MLSNIEHIKFTENNIKYNVKSLNDLLNIIVFKEYFIIITNHKNLNKFVNISNIYCNNSAFNECFEDNKQIKEILEKLQIKYYKININIGRINDQNILRLYTEFENNIFISEDTLINKNDENYLKNEINYYLNGYYIYYNHIIKFFDYLVKNQNIKQIYCKTIEKTEKQIIVLDNKIIKSNINYNKLINNYKFTLLCFIKYIEELKMINKEEISIEDIIKNKDNEILKLKEQIEKLNKEILNNQNNTKKKNKKHK